jgi:hypothetical protein
MRERDRLLRLLCNLLQRRMGLRARLLVREAASTRDPVMTLFLVSREMKALGPELSPLLLREIVVGAVRRSPGCAEVLRQLGDVRTLAALADGGFMTEVLRHARRQGMEEVVELFAAMPPRRDVARLSEIEAGRPPADTFPLGTRKSMARRPDPRMVERMIHEQDPQVVKLLLDNARMTEDLVVKMASQRPTSGEVPGVIAAHRTWGARLRVRRALVFNPCTPPRLSHTLLPVLVTADVLDVGLSSSLHPSLARAARRILLLRMGEMGEEERRAFTRAHGAVLRRIFLERGEEEGRS